MDTSIPNSNLPVKGVVKGALTLEQFTDGGVAVKLYLLASNNDFGRGGLPACLCLVVTTNDDGLERYC